MTRFLQRAAIVLIAALAVVVGVAFLFGGSDRVLQSDRGAPVAEAPDRRAPVLDDAAAQPRSTTPLDVATESSRSESSSRARSASSAGGEVAPAEAGCLPEGVLVIGSAVDCDVFAGWETCVLPNGITIWSPLRCDELPSIPDVCSLSGAVLLGVDRCEDVATSTSGAGGATTGVPGATCELPDGRRVPGGTCEELGIPTGCLTDLAAAGCDVWRDDGSGILGIDNPSASGAAAAASAAAGRAADSDAQSGVDVTPDEDALAATRGRALAATIDGSEAVADLSLSSTAALDSASVATEVDATVTATPADYAWIELYGETTSYVVETADGPLTVSVTFVVERDGATAVVRRNAVSSLGVDGTSTSTVSGDLSLTVDEHGPAIPEDDDPLLAGDVVTAVEAAATDTATDTGTTAPTTGDQTDASLWSRVRLAAGELLAGLTDSVRSLLTGTPEDVELEGTTTPADDDAPTEAQDGVTESDPATAAAADADADSDADANRTGAAAAGAAASAAGATAGDGLTSDASTSTSTESVVDAEEGTVTDASQDGEPLTLEPTPDEEPSATETETTADTTTSDPTSDGETDGATHDQTTVSEEPTAEPSTTSSSGEGDESSPEPTQSSVPSEETTSEPTP